MGWPSCSFRELRISPGTPLAQKRNMDILFNEAKQIYDSVTKETRTQLRIEYRRDCKRLSLPSPRRVFKKVDQELHSRIATLNRHPEHSKSSDYSLQTFNWILGERKVTKCAQCGDPTLKALFCNKFCAASNIANRPEVREKTAKTSLTKYGFRNPAQSQSVKKKFQITLASKSSEEVQLANQRRAVTTLERHGVENAMDDPDLRRAASAWFQDKEKVKNRSCKSRVTCLKKYGASIFMNSARGRAALEKSCLKKYGVSHPSQDPEVRKRMVGSMLSTKYVEIDDKVHALQGYEPIVFKSLHAQGYAVDSKVERIPYRVNGETHYYFPDILIDSEFVGEVKSVYTLFREEFLKRNLVKFRAANRWCRKNDKVFMLYLVQLSKSEGSVTHSIPFPTARKILRLQRALQS